MANTFRALRSRTPLLCQYAPSFRPSVGRSVAAPFHSSARANVKIGDSIPRLEVLMENSPGNKVNLGQELGQGSGKALVIGVPAAFSMLVMHVLSLLFERA